MRLRQLLLLLLFACLPATLVAELADGDLPAARWYAQVDLVAMRHGAAGKQLYAWLERDVFDALRTKLGFDAGKEADMVTALATPEGAIMIVVDGDFSQMTRDRVIALVSVGSENIALEYDGSPYYFIAGDVTADDGKPAAFDAGAYLSLALDRKLLVTSTQQQMQKLIEGKGRIPGDYASGASLRVLSAQQNLVQAGMSAAGFSEDLGWDSGLLNNTRQIALLVAEAAGKIAVEGQLLTTEENVAISLASIVRGLISLQMFNADLDPQLSILLQSTSVSVDGATLILRLALDPAALIDALE
jgi:hypothetical protein